MHALFFTVIPEFRVAEYAGPRVLNTGRVSWVPGLRYATPGMTIGNEQKPEHQLARPTGRRALARPAGGPSAREAKDKHKKSRPGVERLF